MAEDEASKPLLGVDRLPIVQTRQAKIQDSPEGMAGVRRRRTRRMGEMSSEERGRERECVW